MVTRWLKWKEECMGWAFLPLRCGLPVPDEESALFIYHVVSLPESARQGLSRPEMSLSYPRRR
jgi:hypothetical protein